MIDIHRIKADPDLFRRAIESKRVPLDLEELLQYEEVRRDLRADVDKLREERNRITDRIARLDASQRTQLIEESRDIGKRLVALEADLQVLERQYTRLLALVPTPPAADVPEGETDADNVEILKEGLPREVSFRLRDHLELVELHRMAEFEGARAVAGSRAYALKGDGLLLEQAILRLALDMLVGKGFIPVSPPLMVRENAMFGTGYFPLGEENAYELERDRLFLTGTSEVGVVAMHLDRTFKADELPLRFAGISACFRREAGAAGRDTKGLYRVHQFQKIEQVVFCENDEQVSQKEHDALLKNAEEILQALELPYRVVAVCTGDMGLGQVRKHDIETWMPSRAAYGETHSCSTFHDFQSRRLNIRYKSNGDKLYVHTLNNTAIASPRILIAFLENHQMEDGSIYIPPALRQYMQGRERIVVA
jgi:seryl-tRNA synthetase